MIVEQALNIDLSPLKPFVETDVEISKEQIINRCAGKVDYSLYTLLKLLQFYRLGKDHYGKLYLI